MFGLRDNRGGGLVGTFYDFKKDAGGKPNGVKQNREIYTDIIRKFTGGE